MVMNIYWIVIGCLILLSIFLLIKALKREKINKEIIEANSKADQIHTALLEKITSLKSDIEKSKVQRDEIYDSLDLLEK